MMNVLDDILAEFDEGKLVSKQFDMYIKEILHEDIKKEDPADKTGMLKRRMMQRQYKYFI